MSDRVKTLAEAEKEAIIYALSLSRGRIHLAAKKLGISYISLYRRIKKHNIEKRIYKK